MKDFTKISNLMRADWDRRISHDHRFWMSDGYADDQSMWESGERDFAIISKDIPDPQRKGVLEIGCGVGRLLRAATQIFGEVTGLDVSAKALEKAKEYLSGRENLKLCLGNGVDLRELPNQSYDFVYSFAALTSIPAEVTANYLCEMQRVLKPEGIARVQLYFGNEQQLSSSDTLHLRCYKRQNFEKAVTEAGFEVQWTEELKLPFQVSFEELGIEACIVSLKKRASATTVVSDTVASLLLPGGEKQGSSNSVADSELEGWMALRYAEELAKRGEILHARETLEYVENHCRVTTIDISDILTRITALIERAPLPAPGHSSILDQNLEVLRTRFPNLFATRETILPSSSDIEVRSTEEGPVLFLEGNCLDHPTKPRSAAEAWSKRTVQETRISDASGITVYGLGAGYHIECLLAATSKEISVIEPSWDVFNAALSQRDLRAVFNQVVDLHVGTELSNLNFRETSELLVRPQTQASFAQHCSQTRSAFYGKRGVNVLRPKIAVLGPMQGGTLPIGAYCTKALMDMNQRHRLWDMSGFLSGYQNFDHFIFDKMRQVNVQGQYVEMLSQVILDSASEKPVDILLCMAQAPLSIRALKEFKSRGVITVLWFVEDYLRFTYWKEIAQYFDFIFTIQKEPAISALKAAGAGEVHYLPCACDPLLHAPQTISGAERERWGSPISFVGAGYHNRQQSFASLASMPFKIWGTEWPECRPFDTLVQERGRRLTPNEYIKIFSATDINLNLHSSTERDGVDPYGDFVNPRTFELASVGAFQLVDERTLLPELFESGKELVTFHSIADMKEKIAYYSDRPEARAKIAAAGRARALKDHTYAQRIKQMLAIIYSSKFEEIKRRLDNLPWGKMLKRSESYEELHRRCKAAFERGEEPTLDGLVSDVVAGQGKLTETEQKLLFLHHVRRQIIRMTVEEAGGKR